jgi:peptide chain release factor subunit 1
VFCSTRDGLFEVVQLTRPVEPSVVIERTPYVAPMISGAQDRSWCVALVTRRDGRLLTGTPGRLRELRDVEDNVHGQHSQGGWSQARYERSYENEADHHLRRVADLLHRRWRVRRYDRLAIGGPVEIVSRLEGFLHDDIRGLLSDRRLDVDISSATDDQIQRAVEELVEEDERGREREALDRMAEGVGTGGRGAGGAENVIAALNERRVEMLLLEQGFDRRGGRCPVDGLLSLEERGPCPAGDGAELEPVEHLREAAIEAALGQDAEVIVVTRYADLGPFEGIGAVLRF